MSNAEKVLTNMKGQGLFTYDKPLPEYLQGLCRRYTKVYKEFLPQDDYEYIVKKLFEKGLLDKKEEKLFKLN